MFYSSAGNWHQKLAPATGTRKLVSVYGPLSLTAGYADVSIGNGFSSSVHGACVCPQKKTENKTTDAEVDDHLLWMYVTAVISRSELIAATLDFDLIWPWDWELRLIHGLCSLAHSRINKSSRRAQTTAQDLVQIRSPYIFRLRIRMTSELNGDFFIQSYVCGKIFTKIRSLCPEIWAELWKNVLSRTVEVSFKKSWIRIRKRMISKIHQLFLIHRYVCNVVKFPWRSVQ